MKTIKQIFKYLYDRPMYPYEEDNIAIMINEVTSLLVISLLISAFVVWANYFFA